MRTQIIIVADRSPELDLALDALDDLGGRVSLFSRPSQATEALFSPSGIAGGKPVGAVLIKLGRASAGTVELVRRLRDAPATSRTPIVFWGPAEAYARLDADDASAVNSYVPTGPDPDVTTSATALAQTVHYWALVDRNSHPFPTDRRIRGAA